MLAAVISILAFVRILTYWGGGGGGGDWENNVVYSARAWKNYMGWWEGRVLDYIRG